MPRRVPPDQKKTKLVKFQVTPAQHARYEKAAEARLVSVAEIARSLTDRFVDEILSSPSVLQPDGLPKREVRRIVREDLAAGVNPAAYRRRRPL